MVLNGGLRLMMRLPYGRDMYTLWMGMRGDTRMLMILNCRLMRMVVLFMGLINWVGQVLICRRVIVVRLDRMVLIRMNYVVNHVRRRVGCGLNFTNGCVKRLRRR